MLFSPVPSTWGFEFFWFQSEKVSAFNTQVAPDLSRVIFCHRFHCVDACSGKTAVPSSGCGHCKCLNGSLNWKERKSQEKKKKKEQQKQTATTKIEHLHVCLRLGWLQREGSQSGKVSRVSEQGVGSLQVLSYWGLTSVDRLSVKKQSVKHSDSSLSCSVPIHWLE